jgi:hypothetical protein
MPAKLKTYKVLVFHQKHGDYYVSARTPEEEMRAYLHLFKLMDDMGYYSYEGALNTDEQTWYDLARKGHGKFAKWLLDNRAGYEYEGVVVEWVTVPE